MGGDFLTTSQLQIDTDKTDHWFGYKQIPQGVYIAWFPKKAEEFVATQEPYNFAGSGVFTDKGKLTAIVMGSPWDIGDDLLYLEVAVFSEATWGKGRNGYTGVLAKLIENSPK